MSRILLLKSRPKVRTMARQKLKVAAKMIML